MAESSERGLYEVFIVDRFEQDEAWSGRVVSDNEADAIDDAFAGAGLPKNDERTRDDYDVFPQFIGATRGDPRERPLPNRISSSTAS